MHAIVVAALVLLCAGCGPCDGCGRNGGGADTGTPDSGTTDSSAGAVWCGDGVAAPGEACDGWDLRGNDCPSVSGAFSGGSLRCGPGCAFDTRLCSRPRPNDFNGDGYADVIAGAPWAGESGRAYVHLGGPGDVFDAAPDGTLEGGADANLFGGQVAAAGDVNGDGYDDVVVGPHPWAGMNGRVYVFLGGPGTTFDSSPDASLEGPPDRGAFGAAVGGGGDLDGDGFADILVGAPGAETTGRVYVYRGGPGNAFDPDLDGRIWGDGVASEFGRLVASAGDVNGDGFDDVVAGAPGSAAAYVYFGGPSVAFGALALPGGVLSPGGGHVLGSVASAGDADGDGYDDILVGAPSDLEAGRAYLYLGGPGATFDAIPDVTLVGEDSDGSFGHAVSPAGDVNGDLYDDFSAGAPYVADGNWEGRAYVFLGAPWGSVELARNGILRGEEVLDALGSALGSPGDVNGDGYDDLTVGAPGSNAFMVNAGRAYVYFGAPGIVFDAIADGTLTGTSEGAAFGTSVD